MVNNETNNKLTFLKLIIENHPLFTENLEFSMINDSKVDKDNSTHLTHLFGRIWINNLITIIGKNATGKTTIMKTVIGILSLLLEGNSIEQTKLNEVLLGNSPITFTAFFYGEDNQIYKDKITFAVDNSHITPTGKKWYISSEKIYVRKIRKAENKKSIFEFQDKHLTLDRKNLGEAVASVLAKDDSIFRMIIAKEKYQVQPIIDTLLFTNINVLIYPVGRVPSEILNFLDPTIDYLDIEEKTVDGTKQLVYRLKFKNSSEIFSETSFEMIEHYLSSGTAKGITLYTNVLIALKFGGIIFVDELENHFNHVIVRSFVEYFTDPDINTNNASLVFSTHYAELLNDIERGDEIYFAKRKDKIKLQRYSNAKVRKDLKKSDVYESNYLGGTAPSYNNYMDLKKATRNMVNE